MVRRIEVEFHGETVEGDELDFETIHEGWNEYACEDGTTVKLKSVVSKVVRLVKPDPSGEPIYMTKSGNILSVSPPPKRSG